MTRRVVEDKFEDTIASKGPVRRHKSCVRTRYKTQQLGTEAFEGILES